MHMHVRVPITEITVSRTSALRYVIPFLRCFYVDPALLVVFLKSMCGLSLAFSTATFMAR